MAKKYRTQKEKEELLKKGFKIGGIIFAAVFAVVILAATVLPALADSSRFNYFLDPWDGELCFGALSGKEIFAYSTAIEAIEEQEGMDFTQINCTYFAVDLEGVEDEHREGIKGYFTYWAKKNNKEILFGSKEELLEQGLIADDGKYTFTDGYLLEFHENTWNEERDELVVNYFFHHATFDGRGYTVTVHKKGLSWEAEEDIVSLIS